MTEATRYKADRRQKGLAWGGGAGSAAGRSAEPRMPSILRTVSRCSPNSREASLMLIDAHSLHHHGPAHPQIRLHLVHPSRDTSIAPSLGSISHLEMTVNGPVFGNQLSAVNPSTWPTLPPPSIVAAGAAIALLSYFYRQARGAEQRASATEASIDELRNQLAELRALRASRRRRPRRRRLS